MKTICKLGLNGILAALLWAAMQDGNQAQAQRWEGRNAFGGTTSFTRNADGTWTERSTSVFQFAQVETNEDCIMLHDASREVRVALHKDKMMLRNNLNGEWLELYRGQWTDQAASPTLPEPEAPAPGPSEPEPSAPGPTEPSPSVPGPTEPRPTTPGPSAPGPTAPRPTGPTPTGPRPTAPAKRWHTVWEVRFTQLVIRDDKEAGSGDWRVKASFGKYSDITIVNKIEGASGQTLGLPRKYYAHEGRTFRLSARLYEHDGGIGAKWESVGHKEVLVTRNGLHKLEFNSAEGRVVLHIETRDIGYWE